MKINIVHDEKLDAVKPLNFPIKDVITIHNMMMWSEKTGQITCYVVIF